MTREDHVVPIDDERIYEAELIDAVGNLPDSFPGMASRIARVGDQGPRGKILYLKCTHASSLLFVSSSLPSPLIARRSWPPPSFRMVALYYICSGSTIG